MHGAARLGAHDPTPTRRWRLPTPTWCIQVRSDILSNLSLDNGAFLKYSNAEMRLRGIRRLAESMYDNWEEGRSGHSRMFEVLVPDAFALRGTSKSGGTYREHVVPCAAVRDGCMEMFKAGRTVDDVVAMIDKYLHIVLISKDEAHHLDNVLKLKTTMPDGWVFGEGDPLARLTLAKIELAAE
jgi:hypothetical protein